MSTITPIFALRLLSYVLAAVGLAMTLAAFTSPLAPLLVLFLLVWTGLVFLAVCVLHLVEKRLKGEPWSQRGQNSLAKIARRTAVGSMAGIGLYTLVRFNPLIV